MHEHYSFDFQGYLCIWSKRGAGVSLSVALELKYFYKELSHMAKVCIRSTSTNLGNDPWECVYTPPASFLGRKVYVGDVSSDVIGDII